MPRPNRNGEVTPDCLEVMGDIAATLEAYLIAEPEHFSGLCALFGGCEPWIFANRSCYSAAADLVCCLANARLIPAYLAEESLRGVPGGFNPKRARIAKRVLNLLKSGRVELRRDWEDYYRWVVDGKKVTP